MGDDLVKILPALAAIGRAGSAALSAARASKVGQALGKVGAKGAEMAGKVKTMKESPMGQAFDHLKAAADRNTAQNQQMANETRNMATTNSGVGNTNMGS